GAARARRAGRPRGPASSRALLQELDRPPRVPRGEAGRLSRAPDLPPRGAGGDRRAGAPLAGRRDPRRVRAVADGSGGGFRPPGQEGADRPWLTSPRGPRPSG